MMNKSLLTRILSFFTSGVNINYWKLLLIIGCYYYCLYQPSDILTSRCGLVDLIICLAAFASTCTWHYSGFIFYSHIFCIWHLYSIRFIIIFLPSACCPFWTTIKTNTGADGLLKVKDARQESKIKRFAQPRLHEWVSPLRCVCEKIMSSPQSPLKGLWRCV